MNKDIQDLFSSDVGIVEDYSKNPATLPSNMDDIPEPEIRSNDEGGSIDDQNQPDTQEQEDPEQLELPLETAPAKPAKQPSRMQQIANEKRLFAQMAAEKEKELVAERRKTADLEQRLAEAQRNEMIARYSDYEKDIGNQINEAAALKTKAYENEDYHTASVAEKNLAKLTAAQVNAENARIQMEDAKAQQDQYRQHQEQYAPPAVQQQAPAPDYEYEAWVTREENDWANPQSANYRPNLMNTAGEVEAALMKSYGGRVVPKAEHLQNISTVMANKYGVGGSVQAPRPAPQNRYNERTAPMTYNTNRRAPQGYPERQAFITQEQDEMLDLLRTSQPKDVLRKQLSVAQKMAKNIPVINGTRKIYVS